MGEFRSLKLPEAMEIGNRLRAVSRDKSLVEHFYPLFTRRWGGKTVVFPEGIVTLFREALSFFEKGASEEERGEVRRLLPRFVSSLIKDQAASAELIDDIVREVVHEHQPNS